MHSNGWQLLISLFVEVFSASLLALSLFRRFSILSALSVARSGSAHHEITTMNGVNSLQIVIECLMAEQEHDDNIKLMTFLFTLIYSVLGSLVDFSVTFLLAKDK